MFLPASQALSVLYDMHPGEWACHRLPFDPHRAACLRTIAAVDCGPRNAGNSAPRSSSCHNPDIVLMSPAFRRSDQHPVPPPLAQLRPLLLSPCRFLKREDMLERCGVHAKQASGSAAPPALAAHSPSHLGPSVCASELWPLGCVVMMDGRAWASSDPSSLAQMSVLLQAGRERRGNIPGAAGPTWCVHMRAGHIDDVLAGASPEAAALMADGLDLNIVRPTPPVSRVRGWWLGWFVRSAPIAVGFKVEQGGVHTPPQPPVVSV